MDNVRLDLAKTTRGKQSVLIVDDQRFNIHLLNGLLKNDYKIMVATDGRKAIEIAKEKQPDLILLDVVMPTMDGFAVCSSLKMSDDTKHIPIIFITDMSHIEYETKAFELGAVDYITKPFHHAVVTARVNTHMQLKLKSDLLESLASLDGLTTIPNRRTFDNALSKEWERCKRSGNYLSVLMIDIDQFKLYNDTFGHGRGDNCLKAVANVLANSLRRPGDIVARYGGEEFVTILPNTNLDGAMMVGELFRSSVMSLQIPAPEGSENSVVTISVGVATVHPEVLPSCSRFCLVDLADDQLYDAKQQGRNNVKGAALDAVDVARMIEKEHESRSHQNG